MNKQRLIKFALEGIESITQQYNESDALDAISRSKGQIELLLLSEVISSHEASDLYDKQGAARKIAEQNIASN